MDDAAPEGTHPQPQPEPEPEPVRLPLFPLSTVLFPGTQVPLHVFEDRYRALVHHLLRIEEPTSRVFGSVAIREGYEVGGDRVPALHRVGVRMLLSEVEAHDDGRFDIVATCLDRIRLEHLDVTGDFPMARARLLGLGDAAAPGEALDRVTALHGAHALVVADLRGMLPETALPSDAVDRSWAIAAQAPLTLNQAQQVLATDGLAPRLDLLGGRYAAELRAINAIPSLPATRVEMRWSPN